MEGFVVIDNKNNNTIEDATDLSASFSWLLERLEARLSFLHAGLNPFAPVRAPLGCADVVRSVRVTYICESGKRKHVTLVVDSFDSFNEQIRFRFPNLFGGASPADAQAFFNRISGSSYENDETVDADGWIIDDGDANTPLTVQFSPFQFRRENVTSSPPAFMVTLLDVFSDIFDRVGLNDSSSPCLDDDITVGFRSVSSSEEMNVLFEESPVDTNGVVHVFMRARSAKELAQEAEEDARAALRAPIIQEIKERAQAKGDSLFSFYRIRNLLSNRLNFSSSRRRVALHDALFDVFVLSDVDEIESSRQIGNILLSIYVIALLVIIITSPTAMSQPAKISRKGKLHGPVPLSQGVSGTTLSLLNVKEKTFNPACDQGSKVPGYYDPDIEAVKCRLCEGEPVSDSFTHSERSGGVAFQIKTHPVVNHASEHKNVPQREFSKVYALEEVLQDDLSEEEVNGSFKITGSLDTVTGDWLIRPGEWVEGKHPEHWIRVSLSGQTSKLHIVSDEHMATLAGSVYSAKVFRQPFNFMQNKDALSPFVRPLEDCTSFLLSRSLPLQNSGYKDMYEKETWVGTYSCFDIPTNFEIVMEHVYLHYLYHDDGEKQITWNFEGVMNFSAIVPKKEEKTEEITATQEEITEEPFYLTAKKEVKPEDRFHFSLQVFD